MAYNRNQARALTNDSEYELFTSSLADAVTALTPAQLRGKVTRTRNLRDKNNDLFRRQSLSVKESSGSKRGRTGAANQRTEQKAKLFDETLKRYENRLAKLTASAVPAPTGSAAAKGSASKPTAAKRKASARTAAKTALASAVKKGASKKPAAKPATAAGSGAGKRTATMSKGPATGAGKGPARAAAKTAARGKVQAAHTRSSNARSQARRDKT
jgi:hypothetical protein